MDRGPGGARLLLVLLAGAYPTMLRSVALRPSARHLFSRRVRPMVTNRIQAVANDPLAHETSYTHETFDPAVGEAVALNGTVREVLRAAPFTLFRVVQLAMHSPDASSSRLVTAVSAQCLSGALVGQHLTVSGRWTEHPQYGPQLEAERASVIECPERDAGELDVLGQLLRRAHRALLRQALRHLGR